MKKRKLVNKVMAMLLSGNDEVLKNLSNQYSIARVLSDEENNAGVYITFEIPDKSLKLNSENLTFQIGDVDGTVNGVEGAVGFLIFIKDGFLSAFEGYTNTIEQFPESCDEIDLVYDSGEQRDMEKIISKWR